MPTLGKRAPAYADTSFLFSLVMHDANTAAAFACLKAQPSPLVFTAWQRCELHNALRLSVWRGHCTAATTQLALATLAADLAAGNLLETPLIWPEVLHLADELGGKFTAALGVRTLDLLHVAAAVSVGTRRFLTCDRRQLAFAQAAGLKANLVAA